MSTIARLVAIQGISLTPIAMAVQGLLDGAFVDAAPAVREFRPPVVGRGPGATLTLSEYKKLFSPSVQAMQMEARQKQEQARRAKRRRQAFNHALLRATAIL
jgi:hypothetical protein